MPFDTAIFLKEKMMKRNISLIWSVCVLSLIVCSSTLKAETMGTAFTYQGRLTDASAAANGLYDFHFNLYDAEMAGSQIGSDVNKAEVDVIDGYFTVELDFASNVFDGNAVWLETGVRPGEHSDPCEYTTIVPRQKVTPNPYSLHTRGIFVDAAGNIGIGTKSPGATLDVDGNLMVQIGAAIDEFSTDGTLADESDAAIPTEKAVKDYVDNKFSVSTVGVVPVGGVVAWMKAFPNTPALPDCFVECNGQILDDAGSLYNGQVIPNLNGNGGTKRFLRGSTTSGSTGGSETHTHTGTTDSKSGSSGGGGGGVDIAHNHSFITNATSTLPSYYEVVWIMRVK